MTEKELPEEFWLETDQNIMAHIPIATDLIVAFVASFASQPSWPHFPRHARRDRGQCKVPTSRQLQARVRSERQTAGPVHRDGAKEDCENLNVLMILILPSLLLLHIFCLALLHFSAAALIWI